MPDEPSPEKMPGALQASRKTAEIPVPRYGAAPRRGRGERVRGDPAGPRGGPRVRTVQSLPVHRRADHKKTAVIRQEMHSSRGYQEQTGLEGFEPPTSGLEARRYVLAKPQTLSVFPYILAVLRY